MIPPNVRRLRWASECASLMFRKRREHPIPASLDPQGDNTILELQEAILSNMAEAILWYESAIASLNPDLKEALLRPQS